MAGIDPKLRPLARGLRRILLDAAPDLRESIKWGNPFFQGKGNVFYIASQGDKYVTLGLCQGALLPNPDGLIEGTGKRMRHVKVRSVGEGMDSRLGSIIREAVEADGRGGVGYPRGVGITGPPPLDPSTPLRVSCTSQGWIPARGPE